MLYYDYMSLWYYSTDPDSRLDKSMQQICVTIDFVFPDYLLLYKADINYILL